MYLDLEPVRSGGRPQRPAPRADWGAWRGLTLHSARSRGVYIWRHETLTHGHTDTHTVTQTHGHTETLTHGHTHCYVTLTHGHTDTRTRGCHWALLGTKCGVRGGATLRRLRRSDRGDGEEMAGGELEIAQHCQVSLLRLTTNTVIIQSYLGQNSPTQAQIQFQLPEVARARKNNWQGFKKIKACSYSTNLNFNQNVDSTLNPHIFCILSFVSTS